MAPASALETAALLAPSPGHFWTDPLPRLLSAADAARYARIFDLQEAGDWAAADRLIAALEDDVLMGHALFQRYMHPTKYRSSYAELKDWLARYADHPGADRIYRLALRRRPDGQRGPERPDGPDSRHGFADPSPPPAYRTAVGRSDAESRGVQQLTSRVRVELRRGSPSSALRLLRRPQAKRLLDPVEYDQLRAQVASAFFYLGLDDKALPLARASAERSRRYVTTADWIAGMAAWRSGDVRTARHHFEALAHSETATTWNLTAGAYWAARANLVSRRPERVNELLAIAAAHPRTFYGLIAARLLGRETGFSWEAPPLPTTELGALARVPRVARAIALVEAGAHQMADLELRDLYLTADRELGTALLGLATRLQLPATQLRLARGVRDEEGRPFDAALFPIPPWHPEGGYEVDRALVFAFMRRESEFRTSAKSSAGAHGLMQLMPRTASFVANDRSLRDREKSRLFSPEFNIALGQKYIAHLLQHDSVRGNLFKLAVAYNAGPGNLRRWLKTTKHRNDPLLFIESIPSRETRIFVERVLTNFWIYRERLRQDTPSLDAVAAGHWPYYLELDGISFAFASHARN